MATRYENPDPTSIGVNARALGGMIRDYFRIRRRLRPKAALPFVPYAASSEDGASRATWFGHSAALLEIEGKRLLLDPMLGPASSPFPLFNSKRYAGKPPVDPERLGRIDAVLLSHNHYDHLHRGTIRKLKDKVGHFHVPSGVAAYLIRWGVNPDKISEHA